MVVPGLVGREDALLRLRWVLDELSAGRGAAAVVSGPPGIGKTFLLDAVCDQVRRREVPVLRGGAREAEVELPFACLVDALGLRVGAGEARRDRLGRLLSGQGQQVADADQFRWHLTTGIVELLEAEAQQGPCLLVLDDAQWLDQGSAVALGRLTALASQLPLGLLVATRPEPRPSHVAAALRHLAASGGQVVRLEELDADAVDALARRRTGAEPGPRLRSSLARAGGNPLFVTELLDAHADAGALVVDDGTAELTTEDVPLSLQQAVLARLEHLPAETVLALRAASVLGVDGRLDIVAQVLERDLGDVSAALEPARTNGLLVGDGEAVAFRHVLIADALLESIPGPTRTALHARAAEALRSAGAPAASWARHLDQCLASGDVDGATGLLDASDLLVEAAPELAESYARRAVGVLPAGHTARLRARILAAKAALRAGRSQEVEALTGELGNEALALADRVELHRAVGILRHLRGESDPSLDRYGDLLGQLQDDDAELATRHHAVHAVLTAWSEPERAGATAGQLLASTAESDSRAALLVAGSVAALLGGRLGEARRRATNAVEVVRTAGLEDTWVGIEAVATLGFLYAPTANGPAVAGEALRRALRGAEDGGLIYAVPRLHMELARLAWFAGDFDTAVLHDETALQVMVETGFRRYEAISRSHLLTVADLRGHDADADEHRRAMAQLAARAGPGQVPHNRLEEALRRAEHLLDQSDAAAAWRMASAAVEEVTALGPLGFTLNIWTLPYVRIAVASGHVDHAQAWAQRLADLCPPTDDAAPFDALASTATALVDRTMEHVDAAVDRLRGSSAFPFRIQGLLHLAEVAAEVEERDRAVALLSEGRALADAGRATQYVARYDRVLRGLGARRVELAERPETGWGALTDAERRVVELVAEGLVYREVGERLFISRRTVETHVANVFRKLGIRSRAVLAREWFEHQEASTSST